MLISPTESPHRLFDQISWHPVPQPSSHAKLTIAGSQPAIPGHQLGSVHQVLSPSCLVPIPVTSLNHEEAKLPITAVADCCPITRSEPPTTNTAWYVRLPGPSPQPPLPGVTPTAAAHLSGEPRTMGLAAANTEKSQHQKSQHPWDLGTEPKKKCLLIIYTIPGAPVGGGGRGQRILEREAPSTPLRHHLCFLASEFYLLG